MAPIFPSKDVRISTPFSAFKTASGWANITLLFNTASDTKHIKEYNFINKIQF